ncbi:MAG: CRISPR-associated helicase Cas3' [Saccharofermentanales bacterium]|jgi:CRISPR-associated endonuclease/helicase Cas3
MNSDRREDVKYAHLERDKDGKIVASQLLTDHLINTGEYAADIGSEIECYYLSYLLGVLHDCGKSKHSFQRRILGLSNKNVNHSSAGTVYLWFRIKELKNEISNKGLNASVQRRELLFYVITAHHGLYDTIGQGQNIPGNFVSRIDDRMNLEEDKIAFQTEIHPFMVYDLEPEIIKRLGITLDELILRALEELDILIEKIENIVSKEKGKNVEIRERKAYEGFLTRLFLSILKTADCFDSSQWFQDNKVSELTKKGLTDIFSDYYKLTEARAANFAEIADKSPLNNVRTQLSELAQHHALKQEHGISQFEMPTGAGKTEAGLRYCVSNIKNFNKGRMIYTAPFLSVVEQSAQTIKNAVGEEFVLEHHSNVMNDEDGDQFDETLSDQSLYLPKSYMTDYWDAAIIVTTMVQFYNTLFAGRAANICRFCKLIDSTIVIDEIQSLPVDHIYCFNLMLNFLSYIMNANILLCSATQPPFDHPVLDYPVKFSAEKQIIPSNEVLGEDAINYSVFERSKVFPAWIQKPDSEDMEMDDVLDLLYEQMEWADSALCILNTKAAVKALFDKVRESFPDAKVVYLTTNLCAAHRLDTIRDMRQELLSIRDGSSLNQSKLICVTTSLIEAGVDVDFDVVIRSVTGADSIEQARGRCNREGFLEEGGKVFIIRLKEDNTDVTGLKDVYRRGLITTVFTNKQVQEVDVPLNMRQLTEDFYQKYFLENADDMILRIPRLNTCALELLSTNDSKVKAVGSREEQKTFKGKHRLLQSFNTASKEMKLIDQETKSLIVPYKNETLLEELMDAIDIRDFTQVKKLLKKLQRYTVNVPKWKEPDEECSFIYKESNLFDYGIYILRTENYDEVSGVNFRDASNDALLY